MPSQQKSRPIRKVRRQKHTGRNLILGSLVLVILVGLSWYVYSSTNKPGGCPTETPPSGTRSVTGDVYAKLNTAQGLIEVQLYASSAPKTVTNFVNLAQSGFYDNLVWHRIVQGFVIQTGDPVTRNAAGDRSLWGTCGSSQTVPLEIDPSLHNDVGYLGMARTSDPNSGTSQFYINLGNNTSSLDGKYTVFGKVISSMDAASTIANVQTYPQSSPYRDQPVNPIFLTSVTISNSP